MRQIPILIDQTFINVGTVTESACILYVRGEAYGNVTRTCGRPVCTPNEFAFLRQTRMWANAQRDGRPAEYRWRPMFNAAKFGWRPLLECRASNCAKTRNPLKLAGVPQTTGPISAASRPKLTILWGRLEEILLLNKFFFQLSIRALLASCIFSEPRAARFRSAS